MNSYILNQSFLGKTLIVGIGNILLGDEGLGVHVVYELKKHDLPENVTVLDGGTAFMDVVPHMENINKLIIIDAIKGGSEPGTVYRIEVSPDTPPDINTSLHGLSIIDILRMMPFSPPDIISVFGIEPKVIDWSMEVSHTVNEAMPLLVDAVLADVKTYYNNVLQQYSELPHMYWK